MIQREPNAPAPVLSEYVPIEPVAKIALTKAEAAEAVGVSIATVDRMIESGDLIARRFGRRSVRIHLQDLEQALRPIPSAGTYAAGLV
ncbi:helix-turn-helix domain-containing protein [Corynebacterium sp. AOP40-9SA-29]|uniref:helix-turn-helix domain-containing protein n=1 Tax=Corynebacterium sp. AOP40-9SA-29 TaxID=3457677 RepID=UPI004034A4A0